MRTCQFVGNIIIKVKWSRNWPGVAQRVDTRIALLFRDRGTRRGWRVSSAPRPHFIPGKEPVPILQEAGWAPGSVWTNRKSLPHWDSIPDRPAHSRYTDWASRPNLSVIYSTYTTLGTKTRTVSWVTRDTVYSSVKWEPWSCGFKV